MRVFSRSSASRLVFVTIVSISENEWRSASVFESVSRLKYEATLFLRDLALPTYRIFPFAF
jgi:hypothetical protein